MSNIYFEHKSLYKYTRVARGKDGVEVKIIRYLELVRCAALCAGSENIKRNGMSPLI